MVNFLRTLLSGNGGAEPEKAPVVIVEESAPAEVIIDGADPFPIAKHITKHLGYPLVDWSGVMSWTDTLRTPDLAAQAWAACERAWLLHFRDALGPGYRLAERDQATILSSLEPNVLRATLETMERMLRRILLILDGIAQVPPWGKDILIVFDDERGYYEYVSYYDQDSGELPFSSGRYISSGCSHFVTFKSDLRSIEPVIAHEMTHGCVAHLPLPLWLNEGIAVNTERRLAGSAPPLYTAHEMHEKHRGFWREREVQQFWSGESFARSDEGNSLSYDLARIIVEQFGKDWEGFR
ncbi:MAG: hypothetical protein ACREYF_17640, partial [Gammaproteobacteria bacterium]